MKKNIYSQKNSKGRTFYLHGNGRIFYFSPKIGRNALSKLPNGYEVGENKRTGLLYVKRK